MFEEKKCVIAVFDTRHDVECAVERLRSGGFRNVDVSVLIPDWRSSISLTYIKSFTQSPTSAATGAGAILGGALGWLAGIGSFAVPGLGPMIAAGPVITSVGGASLGGAVGALTSVLMNLGLPEKDAKKYEAYMHEGCLLISVLVDDEEWKQKAIEILAQENGRDIALSSDSQACVTAFGPGATCRRYSQPLFS